MIISGTRIGGSRFIDGSTGVVSDDYFNLVSLLLPGNGTNGAQNNTFLDSSTNNFTVTRNGNATQGTFSPFSQPNGYWSAYLQSGASLGLYFGAQSAFSFGTGDFSIELWVYLVPTGAAQVIVDFRPGNTNGVYPTIYLNNTDTKIYYYVNTANRITADSTFQYYQWTHIAVTRSGTATKLFINGVQEGSTYVDSNNYLVGANRPYTGNGYNSDSHMFGGQISNLRIVKGQPVYTSNFVPSTTPLTTTSQGVTASNVSCLTAQSNRFIDNSTNAFTVNTVGTMSINSFNPFDPTAAYSTSTVGGSAYLDGTGDYLDIAHDTNLTFPGDFTVEFWAYPTSESGTREWYSKGYGFQLYSSATSWYLALSSNNSSTYFLNNTFGTLKANQWQHIVITRSGNSYFGFVNGVASSLVTSASAPSTGTSVLRIGDWSGGAGYAAVGYISNVRFVQGTAVYGTSNFTPPTAPVSAISNTQLLLNYTNAGIADSTAKNVLETAGNAQISTTQSKWGGSSMYLDGSTGYLPLPITPPLSISLGSTYTIEAWIYIANNTGVKAIYSTSVASTSNYGYLTFYVNGSSLGFYVRAATGGAETGIVAGTVSANTWTHVAISVNSNSGRLYVNGTQVGSTTTINTTTFTPVWITVGADRIQSYNFNGYINDLRITRGYARYTSNFTPPTQAFPTQ